MTSLGKGSGSEIEMREELEMQERKNQQHLEVEYTGEGDMILKAVSLGGQALLNCQMVLPPTVKENPESVRIMAKSRSHDPLIRESCLMNTNLNMP